MVVVAVEPDAGGGDVVHRCQTSRSTDVTL